MSSDRWIKKLCRFQKCPEAETLQMVWRVLWNSEKVADERVALWRGAGSAPPRATESPRARLGFSTFRNIVVPSLALAVPAYGCCCCFCNGSVHHQPHENFAERNSTGNVEPIPSTSKQTSERARDPSRRIDVCLEVPTFSQYTEKKYGRCSDITTDKTSDLV